MKCGIQTFTEQGLIPTIVHPSYPSTGAAFNRLTGVNPASFYVFTELGPANLLDRVGVANLVDGTAASRRTSAMGKSGMDYTVAGRHTADVNAPGAASCIMGAVVMLPVLAPLAGILSVRFGDGGTPGVGVYKNGASSTIVFSATDDAGTNTNFSYAGTSLVAPVRPALYILQLDRTAQVLRGFIADGTRILYNNSASIATHTTYAAGANSVFGFGGYKPGVSVVNGAIVSLAFYATGAQTEGALTPTNIARRLGFSV